MFAVLLFAGLYLLDWPTVKTSKKSIKRSYFAVLTLFLAWNTLALTWPTWPNPNQVLLLLFGWVDHLML